MEFYVYRVLNLDEWCEFKKKKYFLGNSTDKKSGFIHLSTSDQLKKTIEIHFKDIKNLVVLKINLKKLKRKIVWEESRDGKNFPHLYDFLPIECVKEIKFL